MKILSVENIRLADEFTIENEPISSLGLMERAGSQCSNYILSRLNNPKFEFVIFVGPGNNGGDGLVVARILKSHGKKVRVLNIKISDKYSSDFMANLQKSIDDNIEIIEIFSKDDIGLLDENEVIIDAIFGSGLNKPVDGNLKEIFSTINSFPNLTISIDIPSGLFADYSNIKFHGEIIQADITLSLQFPKMSMMAPENGRFVGELILIPIGLHSKYVSEVKAEAIFLDTEIISNLLMTRSKFDHKGVFGHVLVAAGSNDKCGAAIISAKAALKTGAGLVTAHVPSSCVFALNSHLPECMVSIDSNELNISKLPDIQRYNSIAIGPGIGTSRGTSSFFKLLIQESKIPLVIDADALNIISENKTWLSFLPKGSILTPHLKEFERLTGKCDNHFERLNKLKDFSMRFGVFTILKGAHTAVCCPDGSLYFNSTGNPGMATAGSGDVLTGIIASLLAQGYSPHDACLIGVYLHGLAGDLAAEAESQESVIASDIIIKLGQAYKLIKKNLIT